MSNKTTPVDHVRLGAISAAIWANDTDSGVRYGVTLERRYFDQKTEKWNSSTTFNRDDLLVLAKVADLAHSRIHDLQAASRSQDREQQDDGDNTQSSPPARRAGGTFASSHGQNSRSQKSR